MQDIKLTIMNTSFNLELRLPKQDGTCPIYLRITQNKKKKRISTNISVKADDFNKKAVYGKWIRKSNPNHNKLNIDLENQIEKAKDAFKKVKEKRLSPSVSNIIAEVRTKSSGSFIEYYEEKLEEFNSTKSISYCKHLKSKLNNLIEFIKEVEHKGKDELMFQDVNVAFLNKFEAYLMGKKRKKGALNGNSTTSNLRAIRTIIYKAIEEDKFIGKNPFSIKRLKEFKVVKGKLSITDIKKLESLNLEKGSRLWHTLNYFLFSFYAAGIRFADVAQLKWENIIDDRLSFTIDKTEEGHSLKLIPKALAILDNYKSLNNKPNSYIFPMLDELPTKYNPLMLHNLISSQNALINRNLKEVQDLAEINTNMTFHLSRHSFADILRTKKASIYDISKLLGHSDIKITQRYLKGFDNITSDEALTSGMDF